MLAFAAGLLALLPGNASAQSEDPGPSIELIDPKVLRVCADPHNLPFSNQAGEGIENKLAEFLAKKLGKSLAYAWFPQTTGFVRQTLSSHRCDIIMAFPQGDDLVQVTNPYYRTAYALVFKPGGALDGVESLADARLKDKKIGIIAGTPPSNLMAVHGLLPNAKSYKLIVDSRYDSPAVDMIEDIRADKIDLGILWGPMAGYFAKESKPPLAIVPLLKDTLGPKLVYRIGMGVRHADQEWKRLLNRTIQQNQAEIDEILAGFGIPLLDEKDQLQVKRP